MASNNRSDALPEPRLQILSRDPDKVYCDICDKNWSKKNNKQRRHVTAIDAESFKKQALEWKVREHEFNKVTRSTGPGRISHNVELAADLSLMTISKIRRRSYQKHLPFRIRFQRPHLFQQHRNQTKLKIPSQQFSDEVPGNGSHMIRNVMMMRRWNGLSAKLIRGTESAERFQ